MSKPGPKTQDGKPAAPPPAEAGQEQEEDDEDFVDQGDEAEELAEAYEQHGGARSGGGGGGGKGSHGGHQQRVQLHSGKGTRHKVELLEHAKRSISPPKGATGPKAQQDKK